MLSSNSSSSSSRDEVLILYFLQFIQGDLQLEKMRNPGFLMNIIQCLATAHSHKLCLMVSMGKAHVIYSSHLLLNHIFIHTPSFKSKTYFLVTNQIFYNNDILTELTTFRACECFQKCQEGFYKHSVEIV